MTGGPDALWIDREIENMCFCCVLFVAEKMDSKCKYNTSGRVYARNAAEA